MKQLRYMTLACAALCTLAWSSAGQAQQAGTYSGTSADGEPVSFIVGTDFNTGKLAVLGATVSFYAPCRSPSNPVDTTWGFGFTQDIVSGKASFSYSDQYYFYITANFVFNGTDVTGSITSRTSSFVSGNGVPARAVYCMSPKQAFSANFGSDAKTPPLPLGAAIHYSNAK
jgi:hypothetical protein